MWPETKFLRLKTPVTIGSRFDDWQVCWLGWTKNRLAYLVMLVRLKPDPHAFRSRDNDLARSVNFPGRSLSLFKARHFQAPNRREHHRCRFGIAGRADFD